MDQIQVCYGVCGLWSHVMCKLFSAQGQAAAHFLLTMVCYQDSSLVAVNRLRPSSRWLHCWFQTTAALSSTLIVNSKTVTDERARAKAAAGWSWYACIILSFQGVWDVIAARVLITAEPVSASRPNKSQRGGLWQGWYACFGTGSHHVGTAGAPTAPLDQTGPYVSDRTHGNRPALGIRWQGSLNTYSPKFLTLTSKTKTLLWLCLLYFGNRFSLLVFPPLYGFHTQK